jgi:acyl-coenzyme A synthetase/AMP-(fatty) acid ligase
MLKRIGFFGFDLPSLRHMTQAGGKLDTATILEFHRVLANHNQQFHVMYGQTEATARISCLPPKDLPRKAGSVGFAIPGGKIDIRSEKGDNLGRCVTGEVVYTGPNVMMGYAICREDLSRGDEHGGVLYTSDIGYLDREGYLYITGRNKRIAKVFGKRVNLDEVEDRLLRYGPTAAVSGEEKIILYCEHGSPEELKRYKKELVEEFTLHPTSFVIRRIDKLPTTPRGKVSYKELEEWD